MVFSQKEETRCSCHLSLPQSLSHLSHPPQSFLYLSPLADLPLLPIHIFLLFRLYSCFSNSTCVLPPTPLSPTFLPLSHYTRPRAKKPHSLPFSSPVLSPPPSYRSSAVERPIRLQSIPVKDFSRLFCSLTDRFFPTTGR